MAIQHHAVPREAKPLGLGQLFLALLNLRIAHLHLGPAEDADQMIVVAVAITVLVQGGAIVGRQPFGGSRHSGTNDKAGFLNNITRWLSPRTIKETTVPPLDWRRPFMG